MIMKNVKLLLESKNIRPSFQRLKIYKLLAETKEEGAKKESRNKILSKQIFHT